jgi:peptidoglycan/xylan/chitin deacetylase (PgdA/CDA1 family)
MPAGDERVLYLTFDDGPIPQVTPWVLDTLARYDAKATFFCVGRNAAEHQDILARIRAEGHSLGNHTWDHANGWSTPTVGYLRSVLLCQAFTGSDLFRPPYGRLDRAKMRALSGRFRIIMWDVLSGDFDPQHDGEACLANVTRHAGPGSIVVFHDSIKAKARLLHALPGTLEHFAAQGYRFAAL